MPDLVEVPQHQGTPVTSDALTFPPLTSHDALRHFRCPSRLLIGASSHSPLQHTAMDIPRTVRGAAHTSLGSQGLRESQYVIIIIY